MGKREMILDRSRPRLCVARFVSGFSRQQVMDRLYAGEGIQGDFRIVEQVARPSMESAFDVCTDGRDLFVSVLYWDTGDPAGAGTGGNVIEILVCPYGDRIGFLQFGAGPGEATWFNHHWPYGDDRPDLASRPVWSVHHEARSMGEVARFAFFRFPLHSLAAADYHGPLGFNVMRTQLRTGESASWSHASGNGFSDASSCGWLSLSPEAPGPAEEPLCEAAPVPGLQVQVTFDFPDEMCGGPYTPEVMRQELRLLKQHGVGRVYWIDYPGAVEAVRNRTPGAPVAQPEVYARTIEAFGGDPMPVACRLAHEEGLECFTIIKPYDLWAGDAFVEAHPECGFRRNPAWTEACRGQAITDLVLYADNAEPLSFDASGILVEASRDNRTYAPVNGLRIEEEVVSRPRYRWSPQGKQIASGTETVRCIRIGGLDLRARFLAVTFPAAASPGSFGNQDFLLAEARAGQETLPVACAAPDPRSDFRKTGIDFLRNAQSAGWADSSEGCRLRRDWPSGVGLGLKAGHDLVYPGMLEPAFPAVRRYWLDAFVRRAIEAGADGVDVRIAHHHPCAEWQAFAYAEPVLEAFRRQAGREAGADARDQAAIRRIRGAFHTQFLREARALLSAAGRKLEAHVEARMKTPPEFDTFTQIHWDCAGWLDEGLLDGISLKYLGPFNPWVHREILPRARRLGIPVHVVDAIGDPLRQPRTPEWAAEKMAMVRAAGLNGLNLYETWVYLRTTGRGELFFRGCARAVFSGIQEQNQESI